MSEGGRTNRGIPTIAANLLQAIAPARLDALDDDERRDVLTALQAELVEKVRDIRNQERLKPVYASWPGVPHFSADWLTLNIGLRSEPNMAATAPPGSIPWRGVYR